MHIPIVFSIIFIIAQCGQAALACHSVPISLSGTTSLLFNSTSVGYLPNCTVTWHLSLPAGQVHRVNVENTFPVSSDRLLFYDGAMASPAALFGVIFGTLTPAPRTLVSRSNVITVVFTTDLLVKGSGGFVGNTTAMAAPIHCSGLNSTISYGADVMEPVTAGVPYALGLECGWILLNNASGGYISLTARFVDTLPAHSVKIYDGYDHSAPLLATLVTGQTVRTAGPALYVLFTSSNTTTGDTWPFTGGFSLHPSYSPATLQCAPAASRSLTADGDMMTITTGARSGYLPGQRCTWLLSVPPGSGFAFAASSFMLDTGMNDVLEFFAGANDAAPRLARLNLAELGSTIVDTSTIPLVTVLGGSLFIRFNASVNTVNVDGGVAFDIRRVNFTVGGSQVSVAPLTVPIQVGIPSLYAETYWGVGDSSVIANFASGYGVHLSIDACDLAAGDSVTVSEGASTDPEGVRLVVVLLSSGACTMEYSSNRTTLTMTLTGTHTTSTGHMGVRATFTRYTIQSQCVASFEQVSASGTFGAPDPAPDYAYTPYAVGDTCAWNLTCPVARCLMVVDIPYFDFGANVHLFVYAGSRLLGNLSGSDADITIVSPNSNLRFVLDTTLGDESAQHMGFVGYWHYKLPDTPTCTSVVNMTSPVYRQSSSGGTFLYYTAQGPMFLTSNPDWMNVPPDANLTCRWVIPMQRGGKGYRLIYHTLYDYLSGDYPLPRGSFHVYDGADTSGYLIGSSDFDGLNVGVTGTVTIVYNSTAIGKGNGFAVELYQYNWRNPNSDQSLIPEVKNGTINITLTTLTPTIPPWVINTGFPIYQPGQYVEYLVRTTMVNTLLEVRCTDHSVLQLRAYDGVDTSAPLLHPGCTSAEDSQTIVTSSGPIIFITMSAPSLGKRLVRVAQFEVTPVSRGVMCKPVEQVLARASPSPVYSASFPYLAYSPMQTCTFVITAPAGSIVRLDVTVSKASFSYVGIHDGADASAALLGRTTGLYYSTGTVAYITFDAGSGYAVAGAGVSFTVLAIDISPLSYPQGEDQEWVYTAIPTVVSYPSTLANVPLLDFGGGRYPPLSEYIVTFKTENTFYLTFTITFMTEFESDYLAIYENSELIWSGSGGQLTPVTVQTMCNSALMTFTSNNITTALDQGFIVTVTASPYLTLGPPALCRPLLTSQVCPGGDLGNNETVSNYASCQFIYGDLMVNDNITSITWFPLEVLWGTTGPDPFEYQSFPSLRFMRNLQASFLGVDLPRVREIQSVYLPSPTTQLLLPTLECLGALSTDDGSSIISVNLQGLVYGGSINLVKMNSLVHLDFPTRSWKLNSLRLESAHFLTVLDLSHVTSFAPYPQTGGLRLTDILVTTIDITVQGYLGTLNFTSLPVSTILLSDVNYIGTMGMMNMYSLTSLDVGQLIYAPTLSINGAGLKSISFPSLYTANTFSLSGSSFISSFDAPALSHTLKLTIADTTLTALELPVFSGTQQSWTMTDNAQLSLLATCQVMSVGTLSVSGNGFLPCADITSVLGVNALSSTVSDCTQNGARLPCLYNVTVTIPASCNRTSCIQDAIDALISGRGTSVFIPAGVYTGCAEQPLNSIGKAFRLYGAGIKKTIIDCQGHGQALVISSAEGATTILEDMSLINGAAATGGIAYIANSATPGLRRVALVKGCASIEGGAMAILSNAAPTLLDCHVNGSRAPSGAGIYLESGALIMDGGVLYGSTASESGGGIAIVAPTAIVSLSNVVVLDNTADRGGGIYADGTIIAVNLIVSGNIGRLFGGGLALMPSAPLGVPFNLSSCIIAGNSASLDGGGIYSFSGDVRLERSIISANTADRGGGMLVTCSLNYRFLEGVAGACNVLASVDASLFEENMADTDGGGLGFVNVVASVTNSNLTSNTAARGAGVYASTTRFTMARSLLTSNAASQTGGGVSCEPFTGMCSITSSTFANNMAVLAGGGVFFCVGACVSTNATTQAIIPYAAEAVSLPNVLTQGGNMYAHNSVQRGYGADAASDAAQMRWLVAPADEIVSGRTVTVSNDSAITVGIFDAFGAAITASAVVQTVTLLVTHQNGGSTANEVVVSGAGTVIQHNGVAPLPGVAFLAASTRNANQSYSVSACLSGTPGVTLSYPILLLPCQPGQGSSGNGPLSCADCLAGTYGSGDGNYTCVPCAAGSFSDRARASTCQPCAAQSYAPSEGAVSCVACPAGYSAAAGATACTQDAVGAINSASSVSVGVAAGATVGVLLILAVIIAIFVWRVARKRTLKKYYLDSDSTIRTGAIKSPLQRDVEGLVIHSSTTRIGGGVYADVYKARYKGKWIALKVLKPEALGNALALDEFQRETVAMNRLNARNHPGSVHLQFFLTRKPLCIGMEFCPNGTVKNALVRTELSEATRVRILAEASSALAVIHDLNIAHLDIKTDNLLLDEENHVKVADFGISQTPDSSGSVMPVEYIDPTAFGTVRSSVDGLGSLTGGLQMPPMSGGINGGMESMNPAFGEDPGIQITVQPPTAVGGSPMASALDSRTLPPMGMGSVTEFPTTTTLPMNFDPNLASMAPGMTVPGARSSVIMPSTGRSRPVSMIIESAAEAYTPQYVDPMRIEHDQLNDIEFLKQADIFSFSLVIWAVMYSEEPYAKQNVKELVDALKVTPTKRPPTERPMPSLVMDLMTRAWDHNRVTRPTAKVVAKELDEMLRSQYGESLHAGYGV